ncbi:hypothetical protein EIP86_004711 [Pleurotus ostreatoroseus]|nr:hypothetical protein EIP86_004711 [Pleurotus ostreatoroseus]
MRTSTFLYVLAATGSAYAISCSSLGSGATDTVSGQFTLSAHKTATGTTSPLHVLNAYTEPMASYDILSTGSGTASGFSAFTLTNGALTGVPPNQYLAPLNFIGLDAPPSPTALYPEPAPWLLFSNVAGTQAVFCAVPDPAGTGNTILALNGYTNLFSLCQSSFYSFYTDSALLFNASSTAVNDNWNTYDGSSCVPVTTVLVPSS